MKTLKILFLTSLILLVFNCNSDDDQSTVNNNPGAFTVTEGAATNIGLTIHWTAAVDPDNQEVIYAVYLNGDLVIEDLNTLTYIIEYNLFISGENTIVVIASDGFGGITEQEIVLNVQS